MGIVQIQYFSVTATPVRTMRIDGALRPAPGKMSGAVVVLHDVTELRRLERVRQDFVANVSHEFKTPLTAIQGFTETLLGGALDDPKNNRAVPAKLSANHAMRLARLDGRSAKAGADRSGKNGSGVFPGRVDGVD